ncbi:MAG: type II secretion system F family protein [Nitrospinaceae bacterium]
MTVFQYKARDRMGALMTGTMEAANQEMVGVELGRQGHFPVAIEPMAEKGGGFSLNMNLDAYFTKIKIQDLVMFTRQLATLFRAGIPLLNILLALEEQMDNPKLQEVVKDLRGRVGDGMALSDAMERHVEVFSELYLSMIHAGEEGGIMDETLQRLADLLERQAETEARVKAALRYPKMVVGAMVFAVSILMWKVVPVFVNMFKTINLELPLATQLLIAFNTLFMDYWYYALIAFMGLAMGFKKYTAAGAGRCQWDLVKLKLPLLGNIILRSAMARFTRVFGNLQKAGVPILDSLQVASRVVDNVVIAEVILGLRENVQEGLGLAAPLKNSGWVPSLVIQMVAAGEESGALDEMLLRVADYYDQEVERSVAALSSMIEPILIVFMAALVLFLALAIFLPMWDMSKMANTG